MIIPCCEIGKCNTLGWLFDELPHAVAEAGYSEQLYALGVKLPAIYILLSGSLPDGLILSFSGLISGTLAVGSEGEYPFTVQVFDSNKCSGQITYNFVVDPQTGFYLVSNAPLVSIFNENKVSDRWPII